MPQKLDECVKKVMAQGKSEESAWAICKAQFKDKIFFSDNMNITLDKNKEVISVRDGVQEYLGLELGLQPYDKVFKIYRSADTIKAIKDKLTNLPVTDEHIELKDIPKDKVIGNVVDSEIVKHEDKKLNSTIAIKNKISLNKNMLQLLNEKNQLSLGYFAEMREHDLFDFEQIDIQPHHLAIVKNGRCGDVCKFQDKGAEMAEEAKKDEEVKNEPPKKEEKKEEKKGGGENTPPKKEDVKDEEDKKTKDECKKVETKDEASKASAEPKKEETPKVDFKDTQEFKDAVMQYGNNRATIILKAKTFLDDSYSFEDKDNLTIMRDVLKREVKEEFKDEEVEVAFKMLKKMKDYSNFADAQVSEWDKLKDKEL